MQRAKFFANRVKTIRTKAETFATCTGFGIVNLTILVRVHTTRYRRGGSHRRNRREWRLSSLGNIIVWEVTLAILCETWGHVRHAYVAGSWKIEGSRSWYISTSLRHLRSHRLSSTIPASKLSIFVHYLGHSKMLPHRPWAHPVLFMSELDDNHRC